MQKPCTIATVGKARRSILSNTSLPSARNAIAASASFNLVNSSMSAPAAKPFSFEERIASPFGGIPARWSAMRSSSRSTSLEKVLVPVPARSKYSHAMLSASRVSFQWLRSIAVLLSYVQRFLHIGHHDAVGVHDVDLEAGLVFVAVGRRLARLGDVGFVEAEARRHRSAGGLEVTHRPRLVPHDVVAPEVLHHHDHEEGIRHRVERAAEVRADVVLVEELRAQLDRRA